MDTYQQSPKKSNMNNSINLLYDFVEQNTAQFDSSHDIHHAIKVFNNASKIIKEMEIDYEDDIISWASMLHDVRDHKYPDSISLEMLSKFIIINLCEEKANRIIKIIENVSYSKEIRGEREVLPFPDSLYLDVISDADRLEAIGYNGIQRCEDFTIAKYGNETPKHIIDQKVIEHCHEKLIRLYPTYFKTAFGKELAYPLHLEVVKYVNDHS